MRTRPTSPIERQLTKDMAISASYIFVGAHHLPHPLDINAPRTDLQISNFARWAGRNPLNTTEAVAFSIPAATRLLSRYSPVLAACRLQCFTMVTPAGVRHIQPRAQPSRIIVPGMIAAPLDESGQPDRQRGGRQLLPAQCAKLFPGPGACPVAWLRRPF